MELSDLVPTASPRDWRAWLAEQAADEVFGAGRCPFGAYVQAITQGQVCVYSYDECGRVACYRGGGGARWFRMPEWAARVVSEQPARETPRQVAARLSAAMGVPGALEPEHAAVS